MLGEERQTLWLGRRKRTNFSNESELHGSILSILNKITPQSLIELSDQMLCLKLDNKKKIDLATEIIYAKAIREPTYIQTYANLCKRMGSINFIVEQNVKVSPFREELLNTCQREFFRRISDHDKLCKEIEELQGKSDITEKERQSQLTEFTHQRSKLKTKMLGNAEFIGELYNFGMLPPRIIISQCISTLLTKNHITEDVIECLAKIFTTIGPKFEEGWSYTEEHKHAFEKCLRDFKELGANHIYSNRIRFMIQDVAELHENNWVPRRVKEKPQRIEVIHRIFFEEEQKKELEAKLAKINMRRNKRKN